MAVKYAYFRADAPHDWVVRETIGDDYLLAETWDYKTKRWVPDADAWEVIRDDEGNWGLTDKDDAERYIRRMIEEHPNLGNPEKLREINRKAKGAKIAK